jgi:hypothetical protein
VALSILYRGPLSSCNYDCSYCPFAKHHETAAELKRDRAALARFVGWAEQQSQFRLAILFTPWGEALVRPWYQEALATLSRLPAVEKVAIQTNLSCGLEWTGRCDLSRLALWCTWHPTQIALEEFLAHCGQLEDRGVRYSVGVVGLREAFESIAELRSRLPAHVYLWINAYKDQPDYYSEDEISLLESIDPLFRVNNTRHPSLGRRCLAGETVISVDGDGQVRRCHFIPDVIGNLYDADFSAALRARACTNATCGCHIGYIHLPELQQYPLYGDGLLERIPTEAIWPGMVHHSSLSPSFSIKSAGSTTGVVP